MRGPESDCSRSEPRCAETRFQGDCVVGKVSVLNLRPGGVGSGGSVGGTDCGQRTVGRDCVLVEGRGRSGGGLVILLAFGADGVGSQFADSGESEDVDCAACVTTGGHGNDCAGGVNHQGSTNEHT